MNRTDGGHPPTPRTCTTCTGSGGRTVDTSHDGKTVQHWQPCGPCRGTGVQGGGR
ncbi:hypothetical protein [Streptomyces sp. C1-2]|uniref:hypothetical protein n=1 Tax=Streptomyces sp. C1-2 TaxID=2720022 RepID=UPI00143236AE|nr:hypothetical protein [Streptomyces sp. C1-2]NJP73388.1 hypothetical protein [Streptomyces sp. C1-2]